MLGPLATDGPSWHNVPTVDATIGRLPLLLRPHCLEIDTVTWRFWIEGSLLDMDRPQLNQRSLNELSPQGLRCLDALLTVAPTGVATNRCGCGPVLLVASGC